MRSRAYSSSRPPSRRCWLERDGQFVLGDGGLLLLLGILKHGSLLGAARQIRWSYRHAWGYLRRAEAALGTRLTEARPGKGASRGRRTARTPQPRPSRYRDGDWRLGR